MPIRNLTPEEVEAQNALDAEERKEAYKQRAQKYDHERTLAEIQASTDIEKTKIYAASADKQIALVAVCKALALPLTVLCVTLLTILRRDVPEVLQDFLRL